VQQETLHFLHRYADAVPESVSVLPGVCWGGPYDTIETLVQNEAPSRQSIRFFLGYTGWSPGQLQQEVNQEGWIVTKARAEWVFETEASALWPTVMRAMGGEYALLSTFPNDPRMN
jgi:putative transcriptional regulator